MANYSSQTVAQLKEVLKSRGLPVNGVKADLISRLEESDKIDAELDAEEPEAAGETKEEKPVEAEKPAETATEAAESAVSAETPAAPVAAPTEPEAVEATETAPAEPAPEPVPEPTLTPEQLKDAAVEMLQKKLARAKKFNLEDDQKALEISLKRVERFGVSPDSAIARDLGYKSEAQKKRELAAQKTKEYQSSRSGHRGHGHRGRRERRYRPYARER